MRCSRFPLVLLLTFLIPALAGAEKLQLNATSTSIFEDFVIVFEDTGDGLLQHEEILYFSGTSGVSGNAQLQYSGIAYVPDIPGIAAASGTINPDIPCAACWELTPGNFGDASDGWFPSRWSYTIGPYVGSSVPYQDEASFLSSVVGPNVIDFEGLVAPGGFLFLGDPGLYSESGTTITNNSQMFVQNNNLYGSGAFLSPQGANPHVVDIALPPDTVAVGFSYQSASATVLVNGSDSFSLPAVPFASLGFFGVTSDAPVQSLQVTVSGPGIDLDNIYLSTIVVGTPITVPADECTAAAGGCNPTGLHEIVLPPGFVLPPGATIAQTAVPFVDPRADASGRCDGQTPLILFDGDLIIPPDLCGSPEFQVIVTEANFFIPEGTIDNRVFPEEFISNPIVCDVPITGDPQLQGTFVWQPTDSGDVLEGSAISLGNGCGSSRARTRGFSFVIVGMHHDFGLDFDADPAAVTSAFIDLTSSKFDFLVQAVINARSSLKRHHYFKLLSTAKLARALHRRGKYHAASRIVASLLRQTERTRFLLNEEINHEGNILSRADNIGFLLDEFIVPFARRR